MSTRYFVEQPIAGTTAALEGAEAQHLAKVMRAQAGDEVILFDGSGAEFLAQIVDMDRRQVQLEIRERRLVDRECLREVTLAVALPKGDRQQWLVEKLTELGVRRIIPLVTERGVAQPVDKALERLRRWVVEASKQCGRNRLMEIAPPLAWEALAAAPAADAVRVLAAPGGDQTRAALSGQSALIAAIGPEGGWSEAEVRLGREHGWRVVTLGPRVLRVETAAVVAAAWGTEGR